MEREKIAEIIDRLKAVRVEKGYSYQKIADMTKDIGDEVSLSTIKRIFAGDARSFRWDTVKPVATVLLGVGFETPEPDKDDPDQPQRYYAVIEGLKAVVEAKGELIATKDASINFLRKQLRRQQIATSVLTFILGALMLIDFLNRDIGFFFLD